MFQSSNVNRFLTKRRFFQLYLHYDTSCVHDFVSVEFTKKVTQFFLIIIYHISYLRVKVPSKLVRSLQILARINKKTKFVKLCYFSIYIPCIHSQAFTKKHYITGTLIVFIYIDIFYAFIRTRSVMNRFENKTFFWLKV